STADRLCSDPSTPTTIRRSMMSPFRYLTSASGAWAPVGKCRCARTGGTLIPPPSQALPGAESGERGPGDGGDQYAHRHLRHRQDLGAEQAAERGEPQGGELHGGRGRDGGGQPPVAGLAGCTVGAYGQGHAQLGEPEDGEQ